MTFFLGFIAKRSGKIFFNFLSMIFFLSPLDSTTLSLISIKLSRSMANKKRAEFLDLDPNHDAVRELLLLDADDFALALACDDWGSLDGGEA